MMFWCECEAHRQGVRRARGRWRPSAFLRDDLKPDAWVGSLQVPLSSLAQHGCTFVSAHTDAVQHLLGRTDAIFLSLFRWYEKRFPGVVRKPVDKNDKRSKPDECDNLYVDANSIVHNACHPTDKVSIRIGTRRTREDALWLGFGLAG